MLTKETADKQAKLEAEYLAEYERKKAIEDAKQAEEAKKNPAQAKQAPKPVAKGKVEEKPLIDVPNIPVP